MRDVAESDKESKLAKRLGKSLAGHYRHRTADEWALMGVKRQNIEGDLPRIERETSVAFLDADDYAAIDTARPGWHRSLEKQGAIPLVIVKFTKGDGECRLYHVPRRWVHTPFLSLRNGPGGAETDPGSDEDEETGP